MPSARNHRHIRLQAFARALVDIENMRAIAAAGAINLRRDRVVNVLLLKTEQRLQPLALARVFKQRCLLQPQAVYCLFRDRDSPGAHGADRSNSTTAPTIPIFVPWKSRSGGETIAFAHNRIKPHPAWVGGIKRILAGAVAAHLHRQTGDLRHQNGQQHHKVSIALEERCPYEPGFKGQVSGVSGRNNGGSLAGIF